MHIPSSHIDFFKGIAEADRQLKWFALADAAQHKDLPSILQSANHRARCLLCSSATSQIAAYAPHLIELSTPSYENVKWEWILHNVRRSPCVTLIATRYTFEEIFERLSECCEVTMPDGEVMYLAFWDPAILGVIMGQIDDLTLHIKGPVMTSEQQSWMTEKLDYWWYWDRNGNAHEISIQKTAGRMQSSFLSLTQEQIDDLVEASIPDQLLYYLHVNQLKLIERLLPSQRYEITRGALSMGRDLGLVSMQDLINLSCIVIMYGKRLQQDAGIVELLKKVGRKEIKLIEVIELLPE